MGRIWNFLNQDANTAMDRAAKPYASFLLSHRLFLYASNAIAVAAVWIFVSRTLALLGIAVVVAAFLYGVVVALWRRR
jgi:predicted DNA repair protein MutK